jgi:hypothetical protein
MGTGIGVRALAAWRGWTGESDLVEDLNRRIGRLEFEKCELLARVRAMPSIDPLCVTASSIPLPPKKQEDFGIAIFGHTDMQSMAVVLEGLQKQNALPWTEAWLDGHHGDEELRHRTDEVHTLLKRYPIRRIHRQAGRVGRDKLVIQGLVEMCNRYKDMLILEEDRFPSDNQVAEFRQALDQIRNNKAVFSVYGQSCGRFRRCGWATTGRKLMPVLRQLIDCYSMSEENYLEFARLALTPDIKARIDITPLDHPSVTVERFFAWEEALCLLVALNNQGHHFTRTGT